MTKALADNLLAATEAGERDPQQLKLRAMIGKGPAGAPRQPHVTRLGGWSQGATKAKPSVDGELTAPPGLWLLSEVGTLAASWLGPTSGGSSFFAE